MRRESCVCGGASARVLVLSLTAVLLVGVGGCDLERQQALKALKSPDAPVRARALHLLAQRRDPSLGPAIAKLLVDPVPRVRQGAVAALGAVGVGKQLHPLIERLHDDDLEVRLAAVRVLGDSKLAGAKRALVPLVRDPSMVVRRAAAQALVALGLTLKEQGQRIAKALLDDELRRLSARDEQVRAAAVRMLGLSGRARALEALSARLSDPSELVRRAAARAVGRIGGAAAQRALRGLLKQGSEGRLAAAWGLRFLRPTDWASLRALVDDAQPTIAEAALLAVAAQTERPPPELATSLCQRLRRDDAVELQRAAARAVARFSAGGAMTGVPAGGMLCAVEVQALLTAVHTWVAKVDLAKPGEALARRVALLSALGPKLGGEALVALARRAYQAHRAQARRWVSREGWQGLEGGAATRPTTQAPRPPSSRDKRKALAWLLARFPRRHSNADYDDPLLPPTVGPELVETLLAVLPATTSSRAFLAEVARMAPRRVRIAALRRLGELPTVSKGAAASAPSSLPADTTPPTDGAARAVWAGLRSKDKTIRRAAALACPQLGARASRTALRLLGDRDFDVRAAAARCLGQVGGRKAVPALLEALRAEPLVEVIAALARAGDHQATPALLALLKEDHAASRQGERVLIIEALGELADATAAPALERELAHPSWKVRLAAARALSRAARPRSKGPLDVCQTDFFAPVRRACKSAYQALTPSKEQ